MPGKRMGGRISKTRRKPSRRTPRPNLGRKPMRKTQKQINALLDKYSKETLKHLNKLKHHACYNEMLNLIGYSKVRKK